MGVNVEIDFTYLQGTVEAPPCAGVAEAFPPPFYAVWDGNSPSTVLAATELIASSISTNKPDVIFAHSDGGAAALTTLLHRPVNVKCLVLIASTPPFDVSGRRRLDVSMTGGPLIHIPTHFVRGENDPAALLVAMTKELVGERNLMMYSFGGGHEVPNSSERRIWAQIAQNLVDLLGKA